MTFALPFFFESHFVSVEKSPQKSAEMNEILFNSADRPNFSLTSHPCTSSFFQS